MCSLPIIFPYEMEALLSALRRDLRNEQAKLLRDDADVHYHSVNVRASLRLLEILNPRGPNRAKHKMPEKSEMSNCVDIEHRCERDGAKSAGRTLLEAVHETT